MQPAVRIAALAGTMARDLARWPVVSLSRARATVANDAIDEGIAWLCRSHDVTGRQGSSKGFSFLEGWRPAFPETTGYVIGTLLARAAQSGDDGLVERAREMGDWEIEVQGADGGIMEGDVTQVPRRSIIFNTGMVMHGWLDLHQFTGGDRYLDAARRAGDFLLEHQLENGSWSGKATYAQIPHTYNSRVAWALVRLASAVDDDLYRAAARRKLDWVLLRQRANGWFDDCTFKPGVLPSTHSIAYTLRGLLESGLQLGEEEYIQAALSGSTALLDVLESKGRLPATYDAQWRPRAWYECLTGTAQLGGVWQRQHQVMGGTRLRESGLAAVEQAAARQVRSGPPAIRGALAGSFPIFGRYAPLQYPNWAVKFLVDSLMLREHVMTAGEDEAAVPGSTPRAIA